MEFTFSNSYLHEKISLFKTICTQGQQQQSMTGPNIDKEIKELLHKVESSEPFQYLSSFILDRFSMKFHDSIREISLNSIPVLYHEDFLLFQSIIRNLHNEFGIDIEQFINVFNTQFNYEFIFEDDFCYNTIKQDFNIDLNNINDLTLKNLFNIFYYKCSDFSDNNSIITFYYSFKKTSNQNIADCLLLRTFYIISNPHLFNNEWKLSVPRKCRWMDFYECYIPKLSEKQLLEIVSFLFDIPLTYNRNSYINYRYFQIEKYVSEYIIKSVNDSNLYSMNTQNVQIDSIPLNDESLNVDLLLKIDPLLNIIRRFEKMKLDSSSLLSLKNLCSEVSGFIEKHINIYYVETSLIYMLIVLNLYIVDKEYDKVYHAIKIMCGKIIDTSNDHFKKLNHHQSCLLLQICIGSLDKYYKYNNVNQNQNSVNTVAPKDRMSPLFRSIVNKIIKYLKKSSCKEYCQYNYTSKTYTIHCGHKTLTYYSYIKWWKMYEILVYKIYNKDLTDPNIPYYKFIENSFQLFYPKDSFCDNCYTYYKNIECLFFNSINNVSLNPSSNLISPDQFLLFVLNSDIPKFRYAYHSHCDIQKPQLMTIYNQHKSEIESKKLSAGQKLTIFLKSLQKI